MAQKDLFEKLLHTSDLNIAGANISLASALTLSTSNQVEFEYNKESGSWTATGELPPPGDLVDLGLPSGLKWAKYNVDATHGNTPESWYGGYYSWGALTGSTEGKTNFSWATYEFGSSHPFTKYDTDGKTELELVDDVAYVKEGLRIPTDTECQELISNTEKEWVENYSGITGLNGYTFKKNGKTLFIPANGYYGGGNAGESGYLWSATLVGTQQSGGALDFDFNSEGLDVFPSNRYRGCAIRGVKD